MLRKALGPVAVQQGAQAGKMGRVQRAVPTNGQADSVHRQRIMLPQRRELGMRPTAVAHVVLGMDFDEPHGRGSRRQGLEMLRLEADTGARRKGTCFGHRTLQEERVPAAPAPVMAQAGWSMPMPLGVLRVVQVPLATYFQALAS